MPAKNKFARVFGLAKGCGLDSDGLHDVIKLRFGKDSLRDLTAAELGRLTADFTRALRRPGPATRNAWAKHGTKAYDDSGDAVELVPAWMLKTLRKAAGLRGWTEETLAEFTKRQLHGRNKILTMADFNKVFRPIKRMNREDGIWPPGGRSGKGRRAGARRSLGDAD